MNGLEPGSLDAIFASAKVTQSPTGLMIESAPGRYVAWIAVFLVVVTVAGVLWRRGFRHRLVKVAFISAFVIPIVVVPGIATESIFIGAESIDEGSHFWLSGPARRIELRSLVQVTRVKKPIDQRALPREDTFWEFTYSDGHSQELHLSDLFEANQDVVIGALQRRGVRVY
jgi:hypothetical protein